MFSFLKYSSIMVFDKNTTVYILIYTENIAIVYCTPITI